MKQVTFTIMTIQNINYKAILINKEEISFEDCKSPPIQKIFPLETGGKLIVFTSGKCRIMGLKSPLDEAILPFKVKNLKIQGVTLTMNYGQCINLHKLASNISRKYVWFEPELFPALQLLKFKPKCVNVFASGKIVVLGAKKLTNQNLVRQIVNTINTALKCN